MVLEVQAENGVPTHGAQAVSVKLCGRHHILLILLSTLVSAHADSFLLQTPAALSGCRRVGG